MSTVIRPSVSFKNRWYISKHRYYELKHFCLQYYDWKLFYDNTVLEYGKSVQLEHLDGGNIPDPTGEKGSRMAHFSMYMQLVEEASDEADPDIGNYIFKAVTEDLSFSRLKQRYMIPCEKNMYYDRYRKFFWILDKRRL